MGKTVTVTLRKNGTSIGSVNISGTTLGGYIAVDSPVAPMDVLTIDVSSSDPGAATDVTAVIQIMNAA